MCHVQLVLFTTKSTKVSDISASQCRGLRGEFRKGRHSGLPPKAVKREFFSSFGRFALKSSLLRALRSTVFENSRALRKFTYHHEGHEEHEVRNEISTNLLTFVAFVSFVVKISVFFGCGSPALGPSW